MYQKTGRVNASDMNQQCIIFILIIYLYHIYFNAHHAHHAHGMYRPDSLPVRLRGDLRPLGVMAVLAGIGLHALAEQRC